jgi:hypothetical protein
MFSEKCIHADIKIFSNLVSLSMMVRKEGEEEKKTHSTVALNTIL